jgi:hypothetical protein
MKKNNKKELTIDEKIQKIYENTKYIVNNIKAKEARSIRNYKKWVEEVNNRS